MRPAALLIIAALPFATPALAADVANGKDLHKEHCTSCHGTEVYTRSDRRVTSKSALATQVRRCDAAVGSALFNEDMDDLTAYLNTTYYKF